MFQNMWESLGLHQWSVDVYCMIEMVYTDRFKGGNDGKTSFACFFSPGLILRQTLV